MGRRRAAIPDRSEAMEVVAHASGSIINARCIRREPSSHDVSALNVKTGKALMRLSPQAFRTNFRIGLNP
jgi:hypothetical protein